MHDLALKVLSDELEKMNFHKNTLAFALALLCQKYDLPKEFGFTYEEFKEADKLNILLEFFEVHHNNDQMVSINIHDKKKDQLQ